MRANPFLASFLAASLVCPAVPGLGLERSALAAPPRPPPPPPPPPVVVQVQPVQPVPYAPPPPVVYAPPPSAEVVVQPLAPSTPVTPIGSDVVYLRGGGMLRGTLVEAIPNDHATLALPNGQTAVIPWDRIERIDRGSARPPVPPPPTAQPTYVVPSFSPSFPSPGLNTPPTGAEGNATVHIESEDQVSLERRVPGTHYWTQVCQSPCDVGVPVWGTYRIIGNSIRESNEFNLAARNGDRVTLHVNPASGGGFAGGIAFTSVGGAAILVGAMILFTVWVGDESAGVAHESNSSNDGGWNTAGWVTLASGAGAVLVGILLITTNRHTSVGQSGGLGAQGKDATPRTDAWLRAPQWHDDKTAQGLPKAVGAPILNFKF